MKLPPLVTWSLLFLVATVLGGLSLSYRYLDDLARGHSGTFPQRLVEEATGVYAAFVLLPFVFRIACIYRHENRVARHRARLAPIARGGTGPRRFHVAALRQ